jgi:C2 domain
LNREEDPLWDAPTRTLVGYSGLRLEPLAYLMDNPTTMMLLSRTNAKVGTLKINIIPVDNNGLEIKEETPDDPFDFIGMNVGFKVIIEQACGLPENHNLDPYVEYEWVQEKKIIRTNTMFIESTSNPNFNFSYTHNISYLQKEDIEYFMSENVIQQYYIDIL